MTLLYQSHSPYARKVLVCAHELGLAERLDVVHHETSPTNRNDAVFAANPLGKVPVLLTSDAGALFDSTVICDYLDRLGGAGSLVPRDGPARYEALRLQALAQGLCDAGIALRWETVRRPEAQRYPPLAQGQAAKLLEAYDHLEGQAQFAGQVAAGQVTNDQVTIGQIALATALAWLEFRDMPDFRKRAPRLAAWHDAFCRRASMQATPYDGETQDGAPR
ncbi:glutathione S-transferase [Bosea sp. Root381]|uniref:glutathione S-transferase family protein n=1 Tax=Bosea sp. Root381 TaxID=1736524 RepID=UPI0006FB8B5C|nr:glutathione S-transferase [Bosea sp. Root381]KRE12037.1 glutathione S-transferase [Bosea sp. Root381]